MKVEVTREHWDKAVKRCKGGSLTSNCLMSVALSDHFKKPTEVGFHYATVNDKGDIMLGSEAMSLITKFDNRNGDNAPITFPVTVEIYED